MNTPDWFDDAIKGLNRPNATGASGFDQPAPRAGTLPRQQSHTSVTLSDSFADSNLSAKHYLSNSHLRHGRNTVVSSP